MQTNLRRTCSDNLVPMPQAIFSTENRHFMIDFALKKGKEKPKRLQTR